MKPGSRVSVPAVSDAVKRAAALCDPAETDETVTALVAAFEDDNRPATAADDLLAELLETVRGVDSDDDSGVGLMTAASAAWLATNPDQGDDADHVLRESCRLAFGDSPPESARRWLAER